MWTEQTIILIGKFAQKLFEKENIAIPHDTNSHRKTQEICNALQLAL